MSGNDELSYLVLTLIICTFTEATNDDEIQKIHMSIAEYVMSNQQYKDCEKHRFLAKSGSQAYSLCECPQRCGCNPRNLSGTEALRKSKYRICDILMFFICECI